MQNKKEAVTYTIKYSLIQGSYWPICCGVVSFLSVYLLSLGFVNSQIGIILAGANVLAVFLQPALATFADTTTKISLKNLTILIALVGAIGCTVICFVPLTGIVLSVLFVLVITLIFALQPLTNALGMDLVNRKISINFGLARGIGSIMFAVFSYIIGAAVDAFGPSSAQKIALGLFLLFIVFTFALYGRNFESTHSLHSDSNQEKPQALGIWAFMLKYKRFMLLIVAVSLTFCAHMMINNYTIQITTSVGGDAKSMGTAIALAAAVELPAMAIFTTIAKKIRCSVILKLSFFFFVIKMLLTLLAPNMLVIYISQVFQFPSYAFFIPASIYYVNQVIGEADLVKGQAFMTVAITVGGVLASLLGGILLDGPGVKVMLFVGLLACVLGFVLSFFSVQKTELG